MLGRGSKGANPISECGKNKVELFNKNKVCIYSEYVENKKNKTEV
jgi:hypothetical protein